MKWLKNISKSIKHTFAKKYYTERKNWDIDYGDDIEKSKDKEILLQIKKQSFGTIRPGVGKNYTEIQHDNNSHIQNPNIGTYPYTIIKDQ